MTLAILPLSSFVLTCPLLVLLHSFYLEAVQMPLSHRKSWPGHERPSLLRRRLVLWPCLPLRLPLEKPLRPTAVQPSVLGRRRTESLWWNGRRQSGSLGQRRRVLHEESPTLRASLRRRIGLGKHLRGNTERVSRSSPSDRLGALIYVMPL
jgi:hypothetical protein